MAAPVWQSVQTAVVAINATVTVTKPTSTAAGDLLIFQAFCNSDALSVTTAPTGFTLIRNTLGLGGVNMLSYWRIADGSEGASFSLTWNGTPGANYGMCHRYTGTHPTSPINQHNGQTQASTLNAGAPTITPTVNDCALLYFGGAEDGAQTATPPTGYTERSDQTRCETATSSQTFAAATGTVSNTFTVTGDKGAQIIAIAPPTNAAISTLTDAFTTIGAAWTDWGGAQTTIVSNELNVSSLISSATYYGINSVAQYDLTGTQASIKVVNQGNQALASWEAYPLFLYRDASNDVSFLISGGNLGARKTIAGVNTAQGSTATFSLVTHKFLRIRESAGTVYWDYSADGSSWTNLTSIAVSSLFPVTSLTAQVIVGTYASEASATTLKVDDFNILVVTYQVTGSYAGAGAYSATATKTIAATGSYAGAGAYSATGVKILPVTGSYAGSGTYSGTALQFDLHDVPTAKVYLETTAGVWVDVTADFQKGSTKRGRQAELDKYSTGTATLQFINSARKYDPLYAAGPLYGYLDLRHRMKIEAVHGITTYPIFLGYIDKIQDNRVLRDNAVITTIYLSDYFKVLNKYTINGTSFSSELSGTRIDNVLDIIDAASPRNTDAGSTTLQAGTYSSTLLSHAQNVAITEFGDFFIQADGVIRYKSRDSALSEPLHGTFGDGVGEHHYRALTPSYDDAYIRNPVTVDRDGGTAQTASDAALYAAPPTGYGRNHFTLSGTYHNSDANALSAAQYILARFKLPKRRVLDITVGPVPFAEAPLTYPEILSRELTQRIMINERPMGIDPIIQQASVIEGIEHQFSPKTWTTKFNVSPGFGDGAFWVLGVSALGTQTVLYF